MSEPVLLLSAAEASADALGAELVRALRRRRPGLRVLGLAGPRMRAEGVEPLGRSEALGVMGVAELWGALGRLWSARRALERALDARPALFVPVDAPDLHLPLLPRAQARGVPVVLLGSPQVWAWRPGRARRIAALAREVLCLLPFEPALYTAHGGRATWIGHPAVDRAPPRPRGEGWALLPGSRRAELRRLLPDLLRAAELLRAEAPGVPVRLGLAAGLSRRELEQAAGGALGGVEVVEGLEAAAAPARACLVASGTATLELAAMDRPMVICARVHPLTWALGRLLVRGIRHVGLPNLLLDEGAVPEHLQRFTPAELAASARAAAGGAQDGALARVRALLGPPGVADRAAERVLAALEAA